MFIRLLCSGDSSVSVFLLTDILSLPPDDNYDMSAFHETNPKVENFTTTERAAVQWASTVTDDEEADAEHNLRTICSKLAGPFKLVPWQFHSYGAYLRHLTIPEYRDDDAPQWRHRLVVLIKAYREVYNNAGGAHPNHWSIAGGEIVKVNFHGLDPDEFPDEYVDEGRNARSFRFLCQRRLFGVAMNTDLETYGVEAFTDWEFTGQFPYIETVAQAVHTGHGAAGHTEGLDHTSFHGYAHTVGGAVPDRERLALPNSHRVGQGPWDRLMALCDERGSPFPEPDLPALFPINSSKRMYK